MKTHERDGARSHDNLNEIPDDVWERMQADREEAQREADATSVRCSGDYAALHDSEGRAWKVRIVPKGDRYACYGEKRNEDGTYTSAASRHMPTANGALTDFVECMESAA